MKVLRRAFLAAGVMALVGDRAYAGSGPARLVCKAHPGVQANLVLEGLVPHSEDTLELTVSDGTSMLKFLDDDSVVRRIEHFDRGIFTMSVARYADPAVSILIYAIPETVKGKRSNSITHMKFDAFVRAPNPKHRRSDDFKTASSFELQMSCSYDNEV
jgi:hypothetical protein